MQTLIAIGACSDSDTDQALALASGIPRTFFRNPCRSESDCLCDLPLSDALDFMKGLVTCEKVGISPYPGSTSLVISAFTAVRNRPQDEWARIAVWIVQNRDNPHSPFSFRCTREHWEAALRESSDPLQVAARAAEIESLYQVGKHATAERQAVREGTARLKTGHAPDSPEMRQRIVEELEREAGWPEE